MTDGDLAYRENNGVEVAVRSIFGDIVISRYKHWPDPVQMEGPKPYLHPVRTLAGDIVTGYRPHDHRWHKGIQLTATDVNGHNLWGGGTFLTEEGRYRELDNVGTMRVEGNVDVRGDAAEVVIEHSLTWTTIADNTLASEQRRLRFHGVDKERGIWLLDWSSEIRNETDDVLKIGSPATRGLLGSGYSGLMWRGPRSFTRGAVLAPTGEVDPAEFRGEAAPWLAFTGKHDEVDRASTLVFAPHPDNNDAPPPWFVRSAEYPIVNPSWAFHQTLDVQPGETIQRHYRLAIVEGAMESDDIDTWYEGQTW